MRRVQAGDGLPARAHQRAEGSGIETALGSVPVQDVGPHPLERLERPPGGGDVSRTDVPLHRRPDQPERQFGCDFRNETVLMRSAGVRITDDPEIVAFGDLRFAQVPDMAEYATHRGPETVNDTHVPLRPIPRLPG